MVWKVLEILEQNEFKKKGNIFVPVRALKKPPDSFRCFINRNGETIINASNPHTMIIPWMKGLRLHWSAICLKLPISKLVFNWSVGLNRSNVGRYTVGMISRRIRIDIPSMPNKHHPKELRLSESLKRVRTNFLYLDNKLQLTHVQQNYRFARYQAFLVLSYSN